MAANFIAFPQSDGTVLYRHNNTIAKVPKQAKKKTEPAPVESDSDSEE